MSAACRRANQLPVGRAITCPAKTRRIEEGFQPINRMCVEPLPVLRNKLGHATQNVRGQVIHAYEYTLVLGIAALALAFTGPGSLSLEALVGYSASGELCGVAALFVGVLCGVIALSHRRSTDAVNPIVE